MKKIEFETSDLATLHVEERGAGPVLLFIHGWSMTSKFWHRQFEALSSEHRILTIDLRCHGRSSNVTSGLRIARLAADVRETIDGLGLDNVHAVGWSMGASVLWSMFDIFGSRGIDSFTFVDQPPKLLNEDGWSNGMPGLVRASLNQQTDAIVGGQRDFLTGFIPNMFHAPLNDDDLTWMLDECLQCPPDQAATILVDHCNHDWRDVIPRIDVPVLIVAGAHSAARAGVESMASQVTTCRFQLFQHSRHCPFIEETDAFNLELKSFVSKVINRNSR